jgi:hypothetical protein
MASKRNYRTSVQAGLDVVKRGGDQPPWWNVGIVAAGIIFAALFAWQVMTGGGTAVPETPTAPPAASAPADSADPVEPPAETTDDPAAPAPEGDTVRVEGTVAGTSSDVPRQAYDVAQQALRGFYSVDEAEQVPMADGEEFNAPPTTYSSVTFGELRVQQSTEDRITFVGTADPDGNGPSDEVVHPLAVIAGVDGWGFTPN